MGKKKCPECKGAPEYMLTYGDMMTLLLCFFVMLLAMSTTDPAKFMVAASSFQNAFSGVLEDFPTVAVHKDILVPRLGGDEQNKRMAVDAARQIKQDVKRNEFDESVKVKVTETGIAIQVADPVTFDIGKAAVKPQFKKILQTVVQAISKNPDAKIRVEGHTDNIPIKTREFPSNWELSASRALNVVKYMAYEGGINPANLSAVGYGEFRPIASNATREGRSRNRRIEIYVDYTQKQES